LDKNFSNKLHYYNLLYNVEIKNILIKNKLTLLEKNIVIKNYSNKIKKKSNNIKECVICYCNNLHISMNNCNHEVCYNCYCNIVCCPLCRL
jgi:hypothetical protein